MFRLKVGHSLSLWGTLVLFLLFFSPVIPRAFGNEHLRAAFLVGDWPRLRADVQELLAREPARRDEPEVQWYLARSATSLSEATAILTRLVLLPPETSFRVEEAHRLLIVLLLLQDRAQQSLYQADAYLVRYPDPSPLRNEVQALRCRSLARLKATESADCWKELESPDIPEHLREEASLRALERHEGPYAEACESVRKLEGSLKSPAGKRIARKRLEECASVSPNNRPPQ